MEKKIRFILIIFFFCFSIEAKACLVPESNIDITKDVLLCQGTYHIREDLDGTLFTILGNNLSLDCNNSTIVGHQNKHFVSAEKVENVIIKNCNIKEFKGNIDLSNVNNFQIKNVSISGENSSLGIYVKKSDRITIEKTVISSVGNVNIEIDSTNNVVIDQSQGYDPGQTSSDPSNGICYRLTKTENSVVKNSQCYNAQHSSFTYRDSKNSSFLNNLAYNTTKGNNLWIIDNCSDITVVGNNLFSASLSNIFISDSRNTKVFQNNLSYAVSGISGNNSENNQIYENIITNYKEDAISFPNNSSNKIGDNLYQKESTLKEKEDISSSNFYREESSFKNKEDKNFDFLNYITLIIMLAAIFLFIKRLKRK